MRNKWLTTEDKILIENASNHTNKELQQMLLNAGYDRTISSIQNRKGKLGVRCSFNAGCYKKGNIPINKGTKGMFNVGGNKTSFKKGNIPHNHRPVGSERINVDGYSEIKIKEPNKWILKHRYIYEQHYGKIPDGYNVMFADKNRQNFDIDNLILVSKHEDLIMNNKKLIYEDKELTKTGHLVAKVIAKTTKLKKFESKGE